MLITQTTAFSNIHDVYWKRNSYSCSFACVEFLNDKVNQWVTQRALLHVSCSIRAERQRRCHAVSLGFKSAKPGFKVLKEAYKCCVSSNYCLLFKALVWKKETGDLQWSFQIVVVCLSFSFLIWNPANCCTLTTCSLSTFYQQWHICEDNWLGKCSHIFFFYLINQLLHIDPGPF